MFGLILVLSLTLSIGLVIFAKYFSCDPILNQQIKTSEQLFPLFVMETLRSTPGMPGLFLACLFSAALSTISSGLNSLAAVFLQDILKTYFFETDSRDQENLAVEKVANQSETFCRNNKKSLSAKAEKNLAIALCVVFGVICLVLTYCVSFLGALLQVLIIILFYTRLD
jgi:sodium-dependent multivitamin transporter 6